MSWGDYIKSFFVSSKPADNTSNKWLSGLIIFKDDGKLVVDTGFIIIGDPMINEMGFFCNFRNFILINGELHYAYPQHIKKIDPNSVFLHVKISKHSTVIPKINPVYFNFYFSSPRDKIYEKLIESGSLKAEKIKIIDRSSRVIGKKSLIEKIDLLQCPIFSNKDMYSEDSAIFSGLNLGLI